LSARNFGPSSPGKGPRVEIVTFDRFTDVTGVDAIVNPANPWLEGPWGGLNAVVWTAAGVSELRGALRVIKKKQLQNSRGKLPVGEAVLTSSYGIGKRGGGRARYIIHTVGPDLRFGIPMAKATRLLHKCYQNSLDLLVENGLESIVGVECARLVICKAISGLLSHIHWHLRLSCGIWLLKKRPKQWPNG